MLNFLVEAWVGLASGVVTIVLIWYVVRVARIKLPILDLPVDLPPDLSTDLPDDGYSVAANDDGVTVSLGDQELRSLKWAAVETVQLRTTADGPFAEDVFWEWELNDGSEPITIPNGANGVDSLLQVAPKYLPDFDHDAVIEAMTSVEEDTFMVWERQI